MLVAVQLATTTALVVGAVIVGLWIGVLIGRRTRQGAATGHLSTADDATIDREAVELAQNDRVDFDLSLGLRRAVDELKIGVVLCDASLSPTYRNDVAAELTGTHSGVIVDHHLHQLFEAARDAGVVSRIVELLGPPKRTLKIDAASTSDGGAVATIEDITEQVRIDSMRTDFVANISHELKTPVGAIAVLAEMLADEPDPAVVRTLSDRIVDESHRAARTIDVLLELSSIESSQRLDDIVDLLDVLDEAIARGRMAADGSGVTVKAVDRLDAVSVTADRAQLTSAIGNVVENAVKYSKPGGHVEVRLRVGVRWVEIIVIDRGHGIPARDLDRIFERFYRVDKARGRDTGGTGLGLAIVRHVMNNHGGDVSVTSEEGEGSTFVVRLPARLVVDAARPHGSDAPGSSATRDAEQRDGEAPST